MIADLEECVNIRNGRRLITTYTRIVFPEPAAAREMDQDCRKLKIRNPRFP